MIMVGDCRTLLDDIADDSIDCVVTSPPYWSLRDYGVDGQVGHKQEFAQYLIEMTAIFRKVRRVLKPTGTMWLNLGDTYRSVGGTGHQGLHGARCDRSHTQRNPKRATESDSRIKNKDLYGLPWCVALMLQTDGWYLRRDIIWEKPNCMPESVTDRPTTSHEYVFLMTKEERYFYDASAIREPAIRSDESIYDNGLNGHGGGTSHAGQGSSTRKFGSDPTMRNSRSVWRIATEPSPYKHHALMPLQLAQRCLMAGCPKGGTVLDPFFGCGTTGLAAQIMGLGWVGIELNADFAETARRRLEEHPSNRQMVFDI